MMQMFAKNRLLPVSKHIRRGMFPKSRFSVKNSYLKIKEAASPLKRSRYFYRDASMQGVHVVKIKNTLYPYISSGQGFLVFTIIFKSSSLQF